MSKPLVLNPFLLPDDHSVNHGIAFEDPSLTVQADVEQSDINYIVRQFGLTHELPYGQSVPEFTDYTGIPNDYHAAMNFIKDSDSTFMLMPAEIRSRFNNDAGKFLDFVSDASNYDEAIKFGLVPPKAPPPADGLPLAGDGSSKADSPRGNGGDAQSST